MNAPSSIGNSCQFGQHMVHQGPRFDRKWKRRENQVIGKGKIIRPDKRKKVRFL